MRTRTHQGPREAERYLVVTNSVRSSFPQYQRLRECAATGSRSEKREGAPDMVLYIPKGVLCTVKKGGGGVCGDNNPLSQQERKGVRLRREGKRKRQGKTIAGYQPEKCEKSNSLPALPSRHCLYPQPSPSVQHTTQQSCQAGSTVTPLLIALVFSIPSIHPTIINVYKYQQTLSKQ